jgi:hypothetical protein
VLDDLLGVHHAEVHVYVQQEDVVHQLAALADRLARHDDAEAVRPAVLLTSEGPPKRVLGN